MLNNSLFKKASKVLFLLLIFPITCHTDSYDLYNTKTATSDLQWTAYPSQNGWEEVTSRDSNGNVIRSYQVCNVKNKSTSWVRTPYIASKEARRAYIDVEFSMRKCDDLDTNCRETFNLYFYEAHFDIASSTFPPWRENPYLKIDTIAAGKRFGSSKESQSDGVNFKTWTVGPLTRNGFYIAAEDQGACMSILSVRVYYFYCPEVLIGLAAFPRTISGNETTSLDDVSGTCVSNANISTTYGPRYHCNGNGEWKVQTGSCHCNPGYQPDETLTACIDCGTDQYKSLSGNHKCIDCPENSGTVSDVGSGNCVCHSGYYRALGDDIHHPCSNPPSAPMLPRSMINVTSAFLSWSRPIIDGGRSDLYYNVTCYMCDDVRNDSACKLCPDDVIFIPANRMHLVRSYCEVENLKPATSYEFKISAINGVSSSSVLPPASTTLLAVTKEGVPSEIENLKVIFNKNDNLTVAWAYPRHPNGRIIKFEVIWKEKSSVEGLQHSSHLRKSNSLQTTNNITEIPGIVPGRTYTLWIRAATNAGFGNYSDGFDVLASKGLSSPNISMTFVIVLGVAAVILISSILITYHSVKNRGCLFSRRKEEDTDSQETIALHTSAELVVNLLPSASEDKYRTYVDYADPYRAIVEFSCEILPSELEILNPIGQGEFGEVCRGILRKGTVTFDVAVKKLKGENGDQKNFLREASTMAQFSHPNIVLLKGVVTKGFPLMIVTGFMENGSLNLFLQKKKNQLTVIQLVEMLKGICNGMKYLFKMNYVHRDLAARNILVDSNLVCKVSDFGLSRTLENNPNAIYTTQGGKIAIRWTAPECIRMRTFTFASDVWSYGIVIWEVMSYGEKPYWDMSNPEVLESLDKGFRLPSPLGCPVSLHRLMVNCWDFEPKARPTIDDVYRRITKLLQSPQSLNRISQASRNSKTNPDVSGAG